MIVKIGSKLYDSEDEPILIILSTDDKNNIANMPEENKKYCSYPDKGYSEKDIREWMHDIPIEWMHKWH